MTGAIAHYANLIPAIIKGGAIAFIGFFIYKHSLFQLALPS
jgi:hypothetical protein